MHLAADYPHRGGGRLGLGPFAAAVLRTDNRRRAIAGGAVLASALLLVATPRLRHSPALRPQPVPSAAWPPAGYHRCHGEPQPRRPSSPLPH